MTGTPIPKRLPAERCNNCRFWIEDMEVRDPNDENWGFGYCRRRPPAIVDAIVSATFPRPCYGDQTDPDISVVAVTTATKYPATFATDWCGEHAGPDVLVV